MAKVFQRKYGDECPVLSTGLIDLLQHPPVRLTGVHGGGFTEHSMSSLVRSVYEPSHRSPISTGLRDSQIVLLSLVKDPG